MYVGNLGQITMETRPAAMEKPVHAHAMCTRSFLLHNSKGLGTRLGLYRKLFPLQRVLEPLPANELHIIGHCLEMEGFL